MADMVILRPRHGWTGLGLSELWGFRELLWTLASRDVMVRYKQTLLGAAWAVLQPLAIMVIFTIFFGNLAGLRDRTGGVPYPLFALTALVPWGYLAHTLSSSSNCLVENRAIISKVYFPRLVLPLAPLVSGLVDFAIAFGLLVAMMFAFGVVPTAATLVLPVFVLFTALTALAFAFWIATLNAHYRDFRYAIPFLLQIWFFASPIAYPTGLVPEAWRPIYALNPMTTVIEGFRWGLLGAPPPSPPMVAVSAGLVLLVLLGGLCLFRRLERTIVDVL